MFQFRRFPTYTYGFSVCSTGMTPWGFPHSEICGSKLVCSSPQLIAAYHVLHRLPVPRHSPCALCSLTISCCSHNIFSRIMQSIPTRAMAKLWLPISFSIFACCLLCFSSSLFGFQGASRSRKTGCKRRTTCGAYIHSSILWWR